LKAPSFISTGKNTLNILVVSLVISLLFTSSKTYSQSKTVAWKFINKISLVAKIIEADKLGNLYLVSSSNQVNKYNSSGDFLTTTNFSYRGSIDAIDATNPLEILVFYKELNTILFLDNNLAYRGELNLSKYGIMQVSAISRSYDNEIWIFDLGDLQLKKISRDGKISMLSGNIKQFSSKREFLPRNLFADDQRVYLKDTSEKILVFDVFCRFIKTITLQQSSNIRILNVNIIYNKDSAIFIFNPKSLEKNSIIMPVELPITDFIFNGKTAFFLKNDWVEIFELN